MKKMVKEVQFEIQILTQCVYLKYKCVPRKLRQYQGLQGLWLPEKSQSMRFRSPFPLSDPAVPCG